MSSFYGNSGLSSEDIAEAMNHIIFSKTEPQGQQAGDIWVVISEIQVQQQQEGVTAP